MYTGLLGLYCYFLIELYDDEIHIIEYILFGWIASLALEEIREVFNILQAHTSTIEEETLESLLTCTNAVASG